MDDLVELMDVTKVYDGGTRPAVDRVSLRIRAGQVTAIMGSSGSGKSTLLNLIAGLDRPTNGRVRVDGVEVDRLGEAGRARFRRQKIGLVFQFFNLLNNLTVLDNVMLPARLDGMRRQPATERATDLLTRLEIADLADGFPARLSGGQRQRVAIARALINRPTLLLADEPTGALDTRSGEQVLRLLDEVGTSGQTVVLVTHDARLAERHARRTIRLVDGALAGDSSQLEAVR